MYLKTSIKLSLYISACFFQSYEIILEIIVSPELKDQSVSVWPAETPLYWHGGPLKTPSQTQAGLTSVMFLPVTKYFTQKLLKLNHSVTIESARHFVLTADKRSLFLSRYLSYYSSNTAAYFLTEVTNLSITKWNEAAGTLTCHSISN